MPRTWRDRPWAKAHQPVPAVALVQPTDPQHSQPDPNMVPGQIDWRETTLVPTLPPDLMGDQLMQLPVMGGPLDMEPQSPEYGIGAQALTDEQNREVMGRWHAHDLGATEARRWQPHAARDGAYHVDIIPDETGGASPSTVALRHETGVGEPNSPDARRGYRIWRWRERWIDRHMWGVQKRPAYLRNAYSAPEQPGMGTQYTSAAPAGVAWATHGVGTPDRLVMPQERRTPRPWDEGFTVDGTVGQPASGLPAWGL